MRLNWLNKKKNDKGLIPSDAYFRIYGFMRSDMGLEKTELLVYALIYSYFKNCSSFTGTREYMAEWVGNGKSAVDQALASLVEKGYITKENKYQRGMRYVEYNVNVDALPMTAEHATLLRLHQEEKRKCRNM